MLIKASIIIPVYNAQNTIRRAIDSAVNQTTDEPYEVILINDGSKDGSAAILDAYASRYAYVRVIHQANQGITRTRENGIRAARGEYVFWVDADDYADKHLLAKTLPLMEHSIFGRTEAGQITESGRIFRMLHTGNSRL